jgi:predicted signal transduction protein with EAL and GGDEF domain
MPAAGATHPGEIGLGDPLVRADFEVLQGARRLPSVRVGAQVKMPLGSSGDHGFGTGEWDYGAGLSSLTYLKQIRADELKIDKSFILGLDQSSRDALLVKSTIDLAHSLGLKVTAEGVETPTALALLRGMGCDLAQGYLIGRPVPLAVLTEQLSAPTADLDLARQA